MKNDSQSRSLVKQAARSVLQNPTSMAYPAAGALGALALFLVWVGIGVWDVSAAIDANDGPLSLSELFLGWRALLFFALMVPLFVALNYWTNFWGLAAAENARRLLGGHGAKGASSPARAAWAKRRLLMAYTIYEIKRVSLISVVGYALGRLFESAGSLAGEALSSAGGSLGAAAGSALGVGVGAVSGAAQDAANEMVDALVLPALAELAPDAPLAPAVAKAERVGRSTWKMNAAAGFGSSLAGQALAALAAASVGGAMWFQQLHREEASATLEAAAMGVAGVLVAAVLFAALQSFKAFFRTAAFQSVPDDPAAKG